MNGKGVLRIGSNHYTSERAQWEGQRKERCLLIRHGREEKRLRDPTKEDASSFVPSLWDKKARKLSRSHQMQKVFAL